MAKEAKDGRRRRLKGKALGELRTAWKRFDKCKNNLAKKRVDILDELNLSLDQVPNWQTRTIFDHIPKGGTPEGDEESKPVPIGYIPVEAAKQQRTELREMEQAYGELEDKVEEIAAKLGCMPRDIDPSSGQITGGAVVGIDPDEDEEKVLQLMDFDAPAADTAKAEKKTDDPFEG